MRLKSNGTHADPSSMSLRRPQRILVHRGSRITGVLAALYLGAVPLASGGEIWLSDPVTGCAVWAGERSGQGVLIYANAATTGSANGS